MSEKRIVVPEDAVDAIMASPCVVIVVNGKGVSLTRPVAKEIARRVLRWQSENPQEPTTEQHNAITSKCWAEGRPFQIGISLQFKAYTVEFQRQMYLAPEPVFDATLGGALMGRTFTREQADSMKHIIDTAVHDSAREWDCRADSEEPTMPGVKFPRVEPEVPEEIKDILDRAVKGDFDVIEAYRRGQKAGLK